MKSQDSINKAKREAENLAKKFSAASIGDNVFIPIERSNRMNFWPRSLMGVETGRTDEERLAISLEEDTLDQLSAAGPRKT